MCKVTHMSQKLSGVQTSLNAHLQVDIPNVVISGSQHWLWEQKPHPHAFQTFCLQEAVSQI